MVSLEYSGERLIRASPRWYFHGHVHTNNHIIQSHYFRIPSTRILKLGSSEFNCAAQEVLDEEAWQHSIIRWFRQATAEQLDKLILKHGFEKLTIVHLLSPNEAVVILVG